MTVDWLRRLGTALAALALAGGALALLALDGTVLRFALAGAERPAAVLLLALIVAYGALLFAAPPVVARALAALMCPPLVVYATASAAGDARYGPVAPALLALAGCGALAFLLLAARRPR